MIIDQLSTKVENYSITNITVEKIEVDGRRKKIQCVMYFLVPHHKKIKMKNVVKKSFFGIARF